MKVFCWACLLILGTMLHTACSTARAQTIDQKVDALLSKMTLEEKVGQLTQVTIQAVSSQAESVNGHHQLDMDKLRRAIVDYHVGSILNVYDAAFPVAHWQEVITTIQNVALKQTRLGIPILYGIDAVHGMNYAKEAVLFPQALAMAATRNPDLEEEIQRVTAHQMRACGIPWNFYPVLGVGRTPLWPRLFETFGEDVYLASQMGAAAVRGLQGETAPGQPLAGDRVAACAKHYIGYSFPLSGKDRTPAWIPRRQLLELFVPPFQAAIQSGVLTVMGNSGEVNGVPVHSSHELLTELLRDKLGFSGFVVSDWEDVNRLYSRDRVVASRLDAAQTALLAGVDMSMVPYDFSFYHDILHLVRNGQLAETEVDRAVRRILRVKFQLGLFDNPYPRREFESAIDGPEVRALSRRAARQSIVLLKNQNNLLPLTAVRRILVTGPTANRKSVLNGGWSYTWQGREEALYPENHPTLLSALRETFGANRVLYTPGADFNRLQNVEEAERLAAQVDVVVVALGEPAYCETPGNIHDLRL
ncbi:MAG: glycoside hydrolase family 3 protein, partial [Calditrichaeota bacterium]